MCPEYGGEVFTVSPPFLEQPLRSQFSVLFARFFSRILAKKRNQIRHGLRSLTWQATGW
jgi:hypothetical protein